MEQKNEQIEHEPKLKEMFNKADLSTTITYLFLLACSEEERELSVKFLLKKMEEILEERAQSNKNE